MLPQPPQARSPATVQTLSAFSSPPKKMVSRANPLATAVQAIPKAVWWHHYIAASHTFDVMAPPAQLLSRRCNTRTSCLQSRAPRSWHPYEPWSATPALPLVSRRRTSVHAPSGRGDQWCSSWHASTQTQSRSPTNSSSAIPPQETNEEIFRSIVYITMGGFLHSDTLTLIFLPCSNLLDTLLSKLLGLIWSYHSVLLALYHCTNISPLHSAIALQN